MSQIWDGNPLTSYAVVFLQAAGFSEVQTFNINMGINACFVVGVLIAYCLFPFFGRRTIYMTGLASMFCILVTVSLTAKLLQSCYAGNLWKSKTDLAVITDWGTGFQRISRCTTFDWNSLGHLHASQYHLHGTYMLSDRGGNTFRTTEI